MRKVWCNCSARSRRFSAWKAKAMARTERHRASVRLREAVRTGRALSRERDVRVIEVLLTGNAPSGAWIPTLQYDYLLVPLGASPTRRCAVLCHEVGHLLLHHDPAFHSSLSPKLLAALAPSLPMDTTRKMLQRTGYSNHEEAAAEYVGTSLAVALDDCARAAEWQASSRLSARLR